MQPSKRPHPKSQPSSSQQSSSSSLEDDDDHPSASASTDSAAEEPPQKIQKTEDQPIEQQPQQPQPHQSAQQQQQQKQQQEQKQTQPSEQQSKNDSTQPQQQQKQQQQQRQKEKEQQQRQPPVYPPIHRNFCESIPREVLDRILGHLSIRDIHHLRLAGAGLGSFITRQQLRKTFVSHVRILQVMWRDMWPGDDHESDDSDYERPAFPAFLTDGWPDNTAVFSLRGPRPVVRRMRQLAERTRTPRSDDPIRLFEAVKEDDEAPPPSEIAEMEGALKIITMDEEIANAIAREFPSLKILSLWRRSYPTGAYRPRISKLPSAFANLQQLRTLDLGFQDFNAVPQPVLKLRRLQRLHLSGNEKLSALPEDIGDKLEALQFISIDSCDVTTFPTSLLKTLEKNMPDHVEFESFSHGVCAEDNVFPLGFWMRLIRANLYPKFARLIQQRCTLVIHHPGRDFIL